MPSVQVVYRSATDITEVFDAGDANGGTTTAPFSTGTTLQSTTTPAVSEAGFCTQALSGGAATIDLTSLTTSRGRAMNFTGVKIRTFRAKNPSTNTGTITIAKGASNGYTGFGSSFSIALKPGEEMSFYDGGNGVAVSSTVKTLDLAGTGSESLQFAVSGGA